MIQLNQATQTELSSFAILKGVTVDQLVTELLQEMREDFKDAIDADELYKEFKASGQESISLDEVIKANGL